jgi:hypothetical protein
MAYKWGNSAWKRSKDEVRAISLQGRGRGGVGCMKLVEGDSDEGANRT